MKPVYLFLLFFGILSLIKAQPYQKALEQIQSTARMKKATEKVEFYNKAEQMLLKAYSKDSIDPLMNYAMVQLYSLDDFSNKNYFKAWDYFLKAQKAIEKVNYEHYETIKAYYQVMDSRRRNKTVDQNFEIEKTVLEDKLIRMVREENNFDLAVTFLAKFPDSKFTANVVHIRNYLAFRKVEKTNTVDAYNEFLRDYQDAAQVPTATKQRNELAFSLVKASNSLDAFNEFLSKYPYAAQASEAMRMRNRIAFDKAKLENNLEALDNFIIQFPEATEIPEARIIRRNLMFEKAKKVNTLEAYNDFIAKYPEGQQYVDVFNLKATAMGESFKTKISGLNTGLIKGFDYNGTKEKVGDMVVSDKKIILCGSVAKEKDQTDAWIIALNPDGKMSWNKTLGEYGFDQPVSVTSSPEGALYFSGCLNSSSDSVFNGKAWMFSLNASGEKVWSRTFKASVLNDIVFAEGYLFSGGYISDSSGIRYPYLVKSNASGKKVWDRQYSTPGQISNLVALNDGSIAFTSGRWFGKINHDGYIAWDALLPDSCSFNFLNISAQGNIIFAGNSGSSALLLKEFQSDGKLVSDRVFPLIGNFIINGLYAIGNELYLTLKNKEGIGFYSIQADNSLLNKGAIKTGAISGCSSVYVDKEGKHYILISETDLILVNF